MESNLVWQIDSTMSSSAYLNELKWIGCFQRLSPRINSHTQRYMKVSNSTLYLGGKLMNITIGEILGFFGIMMRISTEPRKMGGYPSYFVEDPIICFGCEYSVQCRLYYYWGKYVMNIIIFKKDTQLLSPWGWNILLLIKMSSSALDLFQPKTDLFSTRALIWVHFKTVRYFSQPIFRLFSYLKNALHNLVIELCSALNFFQIYITVIY